MDRPTPGRRFRVAYLLLLIPFAAMMAVPLFNRIAPEALGIPFFYWYQLLWIPVGAALLLPAYLSGRRSGRP